jgi:hypothetical protein
LTGSAISPAATDVVAHAMLFQKIVDVDRGGITL